MKKKFFNSKKMKHNSAVYIFIKTEKKYKYIIRRTYPNKKIGNAYGTSFSDAYNNYFYPKRGRFSPRKRKTFNKFIDEPWPSKRIEELFNKVFNERS